MSEARGAGPQEELLHRSESAARGERMDALGQLRRMKGANGAARVAAKLAGLGPADLEAALRLEFLAEARDRAAAAGAVSSWVLSSTTALSAPAREVQTWRRSLVHAASVLARGKGEDGDRALMALAGVDDREVRLAALAAADAREGFEAPRFLEVLLPLLAGLEGGGFDPHLLSLLGKTKDARAIDPLLGSMERYAEVNPRMPAPEHAKALRALTGQKIGDDVGPWRAWAEKRKK